MSIVIFIRYFIFLLIFLPTLFYAALPQRENLKFSISRSFLTLGIGSVIIAAIFSLLGALTQIQIMWLLAVGMVPLYFLFHFCVKDSLLKKLYCFLNSTMVITNSIVFGVLLAAPLELENHAAAMLPVSGAICLAVALFLGVIYHKTLTVKIPYLIRSEVLDLDWRFAVLIPAAVSILFYWVTPRSAAVVMTGRVRVTTLAFLILGPLVFLLVYHVFWRIAVNLGENARLKAENELMEMESKRYEELRSYMNETRALRHDFRQHLLVMDEYAKKGETEKLTDYIGQFTASLADHRGSFSANPAVDAVASHYDQASKAQNTHIKWLLELPEMLPLPESDFIAIFGNLVENSINAVRELPEDKRAVHVTARMLSDEMIGLTVKNPYEGTIRFGKNGLPKSERPGHGVGLSSVEAAVHRYNGALDINTDDGIFSVGILLYTSSNDPNAFTNMSMQL